MPQVDGKSRVAGPKRVTPAPVLLPRPLALDDCVHRKRSRTGQPDRIARTLVELEEGIPIARCAVADPRALGEWPRSPYRLAGHDQDLIHVSRLVARKV